MNITDTHVEHYLTVILADQQKELGREINDVIVAVRNKSPDTKRAILYSIVSQLHTIHVDLPISRWLPDQPDSFALNCFFVAIHPYMMDYVHFAITTDEFLKRVKDIWPYITPN